MLFKSLYCLVVIPLQAFEISLVRIAYSLPSVTLWSCQESVSSFLTWIACSL